MGAATIAVRAAPGPGCYGRGNDFGRLGGRSHAFPLGHDRREPSVRNRIAADEIDDPFGNGWGTIGLAGLPDSGTRT